MKETHVPERVDCWLRMSRFCSTWHLNARPSPSRTPVQTWSYHCIRNAYRPVPRGCGGKGGLDGPHVPVEDRGLPLNPIGHVVIFWFCICHTIQ